MTSQAQIIIPRYETLDRDSLVINPKTGGFHYGYVSEYVSRNITLPGGYVFLKAGRHIGPNKGFGVNHIWLEHCRDLPKWGCKDIQDIPRFVAEILTEGANILCEYHQTRDGYRLMIVKGSKGAVILSPQGEDEFHYSVVTAYKPHKQNQATHVGKLKAKKAP